MDISLNNKGTADNWKETNHFMKEMCKRNSKACLTERLTSHTGS
jgi:hypothetical protein